MPSSLARMRAAVNFLRFAPARLRVWGLSIPGIGPLLRRALSLTVLAHQPAAEVARQAQFPEWHPDDLRPRESWYGPDCLHVVSHPFFEAHEPDGGAASVREAMARLSPGKRLLIYAPHSFAFHPDEGHAWVPSWETLHGWALSAKLRILDFNPGFDRNGFFHFVAERPGVPTDEPPTLTGTGRYFYLGVGADRAVGNSAAVLSAAGLSSLRRTAAPVTEHSFYARVPEDVPVQAGDIAMGHYGNWLTGARKQGALTILYGPGDRFRPERHDAPFYAGIQTQGDFAAQYDAAHLVIMQAGGRWRMADPFPHPGLCRWMDLPVSPGVFPRTKKQIAPPGKRVFCFIGLYDDYQKGLDIARELCRRSPEMQFIAIGCKPIGAPNCREYKAVDNRRSKFRRIAAQADFIVSPARDDAQPGTIAECGSLGLLPIISETTGYVLSFPCRLNVDDLDQCAAVLAEAQNASAAEVAGWQALNARYIEQFHRPEVCDALMQFYLREVREEALEQTAPGLG